MSSEASKKTKPPTVDTRSRILDAAWSLLEQGSNKPVRMSDIALASGISRQALYLHFPNRADLLVAVTHHIDVVNDVDARLVASRTASTGRERLDAFVEAWGGYIPEIIGVARALIAMQDHDQEARLAWAGRLQAVREGCEAAVLALSRDNDLSPDLSPEHATDLLCGLLSVHFWDQLVVSFGWSQEQYLAEIKRLARKGIVKERV